MRREFENLSRWIPSQTEAILGEGRDQGFSAAVAVAEHAPEEMAGDRFRRQYARVHGPFDGYRIGRLETPVRIYDLSQGGCFVNGLHQQRKETRMMLKIDLPVEGTISVNAELVYVRPDFGFAVRFVQVDEDTDARLRRAVDALSLEQTGNPAPIEPY
jgi:hypothetical protein